jgi:hypothetical protein
VKRFRRRLFNALTVLSLLLCTAAIVDRWVQRHYFHWFELLTWRIDGPDRIIRGLSITSFSGVVILASTTTCGEAHNPPPSHIGYGIIADEPRKATGSFLDRAGFNVGVRRYVRSRRFSAIWGISRTVELPTWFLAAVFVVLPTVAFAHRRHRLRDKRRAQTGHCTVCGYDLRATPGRCPECGTIPSKKGAISI